MSQLKAMYNSLVMPLTLIQGPPGTGKTKTIGFIVKSLTPLLESKVEKIKIYDLI